jgi:hypothetical protein
MAITYCGEVTIGAALPGIGVPFALAVGDLQARVDACVAALAQISVGMPSLTAQISLAEDIIANLQAAIAVGITPPTVSAQIGIMTALITALEAQLAIMLAVPFGTAGVHIYAYAGTAGAFGADVTAALAAGFPGGTGAGQACNALVLATTIGATWVDMQAVFKTTP